MILPNLNHLKYFVDAVELGSISASAEKNLLTHPAVSRAIKAIENQLSEKLLIHKKKNFEVTPAGQSVAEKAKILLTAAKSFSSNNTSVGTEISGTVSLAVSRTLGQAFLSSILRTLTKKFPKIKINVRFGTTSEIVEKLAQGSVDIGITIGHQKMATLKQTLLRQGHFVLIRSKNHQIKNLPSENFILTEPRAETELLKKQFYRKYKMQLIVQSEVGSWDMITQLVSENLGIGLVPDIAAHSNKTHNIIIKTDWLECPYEIFLNQSKVALSNPAAQAIRAIIESEIK